MICWVQIIDLIISLIRYLCRSNYIQSCLKILLCDHCMKNGGQEIETVIIQEITPLCQNLQKKHMFKVTVNIYSIRSDREEDQNYKHHYNINSVQSSV